MHKRGRVVALILFAQILAILAFAAVSEYRIQTGREYVLETRPVDPRDLFRGDYVTLRYAISSLSYCCYEAEDTIYVLLEASGDVWRADGHAEQPPTDGQPFIRGRVTRVGIAPNRSLEVVYGIESYFVPEGTGRTIEDAIRRGQDKVRVRIAVDRFGTAAIKSLDIQE